MTEDLVKKLKFKYKLLQYMKMLWKHTFKLLLLKYIYCFLICSIGIWNLTVMLTSSGVLCHLTKTPNTQKGLSDCGVLLQSPLVDKRGYKYIHIFPAQKISLCNQMNSAILWLICVTEISAYTDRSLKLGTGGQRLVLQLSVNMCPYVLLINLHSLWLVLRYIFSILCFI